MLIDHRIRTTEEIARLGTDLIKRVIEPASEPKDAGKFVCVDVDTGQFEIADDDVTAIERLHWRCPRAESFLGVIGEDSTYRMSPR